MFWGLINIWSKVLPLPKGTLLDIVTASPPDPWNVILWLSFTVTSVFPLYTHVQTLCVIWPSELVVSVFVKSYLLSNPLAETTGIGGFM